MRLVIGGGGSISRQQNMTKESDVHMKERETILVTTLPLKNANIPFFIYLGEA